MDGCPAMPSALYGSGLQAAALMLRAEMWEGDQSSMNSSVTHMRPLAKVMPMPT